MAEKGKTAQVRLQVQRKLRQIEASPQSGETKALLANLRRGVGRIPGDLPELWGLLLQGLPEELQSKDGVPTREEWAIYTALTLYGIHQQGHDPAAEAMNAEGCLLGSAIRRLAPGNDDDALDRVRHRLNALATSSDMQEAAYHLRGVVQLLRASGIPLDYPALAADLYRWQFADGAPQVRLRWGQEFYFTKPSQTDTVEGTERKEETNE